MKYNFVERYCKIIIAFYNFKYPIEASQTTYTNTRMCFINLLDNIPANGTPAHYTAHHTQKHIKVSNNLSQKHLFNDFNNILTYNIRIPSFVWYRSFCRTKIIFINFYMAKPRRLRCCLLLNCQWHCALAFSFHHALEVWVWKGELHFEMF